jgi:hypothetical protein
MRRPSVAFEQQSDAPNTCRRVVTGVGHSSLQRPRRRLLAESSISPGKAAFADIFLLPFLSLLWFPMAAEVAAPNFVQAPAGSI